MYKLAEKLSDNDMGVPCQVVAGQTTESFKRYPNSSYVRLSFSLIYSSKEGAPRTLDLTANDEQAFELWFCGLQVRSLLKAVLLHQPHSIPHSLGHPLSLKSSSYQGTKVTGMEK